MKKPKEPPFFFEEGIRFECIRCGVCCTGEPGTVYITTEEIQAAALFLDIPEPSFIDQYCYPFRNAYSLREQDDGRCAFFEDGCRIYPVRPSQCRTYPFWFDNLRSETRWERVRSLCPGIGQGRLFGKDEILSRIHESMRNR